MQPIRAYKSGTNLLTTFGTTLIGEEKFAYKSGTNLLTTFGTTLIGEEKFA